MRRLGKPVGSATSNRPHFFDILQPSPVRVTLVQEEFPSMTVQRRLSLLLSAELSRVLSRYATTMKMSSEEETYSGMLSEVSTRPCSVCLPHDGYIFRKVLASPRNGFECCIRPIIYPNAERPSYRVALRYIPNGTGWRIYFVERRKMLFARLCVMGVLLVDDMSFTRVPFF